MNTTKSAKPTMLVWIVWGIILIIGIILCLTDLQHWGLFFFGVGAGIGLRGLLQPATTANDKSQETNGSSKP